MEPYVGEIILFAGNFAPRGFSFCDGQLLGINTNQQLFCCLARPTVATGAAALRFPICAAGHQFTRDAGRD